MKSLFITLIYLFVSCSFAKAVTVSGSAPDAAVRIIAGDRWRIIIEGPIRSDSAQSFERFISDNRVPEQSDVILNSPGGSLYGGIALGRAIRRLNMNTHVRVPDVSIRGANAAQNYECVSACALAFLGGRFRFAPNNARLGVHRFAFNDAVGREADAAQVVSATVVSYIQEMGVNPRLFELASMTPPSSMYYLTPSDWRNLNVVNSGYDPVNWTVEANGGIVYLKGERQTIHGVNKFMMYCDPSLGPVLYVIIDPQGRQNEIMGMGNHVLVINGVKNNIRPIERVIENGWFNAAYALTNAQIAALRTAENVGVIFRHNTQSPMFLGFMHMDFADGRRRLPTLFDRCRARR